LRIVLHHDKLFHTGKIAGDWIAQSVFLLSLHHITEIEVLFRVFYLV